MTTASTTPCRPKETVWLSLLLLCHIVLGVYYSVTIPIWEAHDEVGHYAKLRYIAMEGRLPPPGTTTAPSQDETHQPPLYYVLGALPVSLVDLDGPLEYQVNRYARYPDAQGGHNVAMHDPAAEAWPYRGDTLGVHLARWVSVLLGGLVILLVYLCGQTVWPDRPAIRWATALMVTLWPQFRFTSAVVNNDIAVTLAAAVALYGSLLVLQGKHHRQALLTLGLGMAMLALTKTNGLPLLLIPALALMPTFRTGTRRAITIGLAALVVVALGAGWWYLRNLATTGGLLTGPWSVLRKLLAEKGTLTTALSGLTRWGSWWHALRTFWAGFGHNNVAYERWVYLAALGIVLPPLAGLAIWLQRQPTGRQRAAAGLAALTVMVALMAPQALWALQDWSHVQGRYLLPGLPALGLLLGLGWVALGDALRARWLAWVPLGGMAGLVALTPLLVIMPAYGYPKTLTREDLTAYHQSPYRFGASVEMPAWRILTPAVDPGGTFEAELVWQADEPIWTMLVLSAKLYDDDGTLLAEITRYPGNGSLATDSWNPGLYLEQLVMRLPNDLVPRTHRALWLDVSLFPRRTPERPLAVFQAGGQRIGRTLRLGPAKLRGVNEGHELEPVAFAFGQALLLSGLEARLDGNQLEIATAWQALHAPEVDLQVSVQLRDPANRVIAQADGPLANGRLATSLWEAGDEFVDHRVAALPEKRQDEMLVYLCLYELHSLQRWPVTTASDPAATELLLGRIAPGQTEFEPLW